METEGVKIGDLTGHELIGEGGCGAVFRVKDADGNALALKIFDDTTINRELLEKTTLRLRSNGWPEGVLPVIASDLRGGPAFRLMPLMADGRGEGAPRPRSLQHKLDEHPGIDSWKLLRALARGLSAMHSRGVTHGNLKPGNVFLDESGAPLLADWALGNMPGLRRFEFTDAVLYQPPEQLREANAYLESAGQRCDVFAFGVMAYRVLTGSFPRCDETFSQVAPPLGETRREGLRADLPRIAGNLEGQPEVRWAEQNPGELENGMRGWISRCLELDPLKRPANMMEVAAGLDAVEQELEARRERGELLDQRRHAEQKLRSARFGIGVAAALVIGLAGLWQMEKTRLFDEKIRHKQESLALMGDIQSTHSEKSMAEIKVAEAEETLVKERKAWIASLEESRQAGDWLFTWAMEKDRRKLPPLDGRDIRLKQLESHFTDFLTKTGEVPDLIEERAHAHLQLAEISISSGDSVAATSRFEAARKILESLPMTADLKFRLASDSLLLALLRQANADPQTNEAFASAKEAFAGLPRAEVDADRMDRMLAALDFHEAKLLAARGDETKALEQLMRATQTLNRVSALRPDSAILRSELAACHLSSAAILDDMGNSGDAADVRKLASVELRKLVDKNPDDPAPRLELAGCYGAMAEAASLAGDDAESGSLSDKAIKLLDELLSRHPDNSEAVSRKAAQLGLRAGIMRDRGQAAEAMRNYDDGIRMLEALRATSPGDATVSYQLALLWWQKGRMAGASGGRDEEIALLGRARDLLASLDASKPVAGPSPAQLRRSAAYLAGDLGHALQLANRKGDALRAFTNAVSLWEALVKSRPQSEEYQEGLAWSRRRLADLK
jgi:eukaryotic-like serine/threonine-protein kinase